MQFIFVIMRKYYYLYWEIVEDNLPSYNHGSGRERHNSYEEAYDAAMKLEADVDAGEHGFPMGDDPNSPFHVEWRIEYEF